MFTSLTYSGVKGLEQQLKLEKVTVVCGPNESGKSAAGVALQLAVTGKCEIGARAVDQDKLLANCQANSVAIGRNIEASWSISKGKKSWEDPGTQLNLPVTVWDFWALTGAERLKLIAPEGALASIESKIAQLDSERKRLKTIIDAPAPPTPDEYSGPSVDTLYQTISEIESNIAAHTAAKASIQKLEEHNKRMEGLKESLANEKLTLAAKEKDLEVALEEQKLICSQFAIYGEKSSKEPRIIKSARERGVTIERAIEDTMNLVGEALHWAGVNATEDIDSITFLAPRDFVPDIPERLYGGRPIHVAKQDIDTKVTDLGNSLDYTQRSIAGLESSLKAEPPSEIQGLLSIDEVFELQQKRDDAQKQLAQANAWSAYDASIQKMTKDRVKASSDIAVVESDLAAAKREMTEKVNSIKGSVETAANNFLNAAEQEPLKIEVNQTPRGWSLDVSIGDVALESMARSKRLLYGICLLSAVHEASAAVSPVLIAECAEMQPSTLDKTIRAMQLRTKGNVILEHWHKPSVDVNLINLGEEA